MRKKSTLRHNLIRSATGRSAIKSKVKGRKPVKQLWSSHPPTLRKSAKKKKSLNQLMWGIDLFKIGKGPKR